MKPHHVIPICDCQESLVAIPSNTFALETPHPYAKLGAPYGDKSPFYLRQSVLQQLIAAQAVLQDQHPGWHIQIFDAYRPLAVQRFMVDYTFAETIRAQGLTLAQLSDPLRETILQQVYQFWAIPSTDPATPPPHSTGAAVDVTLVNADGRVVDMGSPIDELSARSYPNFFSSNDQSATAVEAAARNTGEAIAFKDRQTFHHHRQILQGVMVAAGFCQHPNEWWHFSLYDQMWVWLTGQDNSNALGVARYGAVEHLY
jgi:zinc D-Ala-D-Ala dipeptidase